MYKYLIYEIDEEFNYVESIHADPDFFILPERDFLDDNFDYINVDPMPYIRRFLKKLDSDEK